VSGDGFLCPTCGHACPSEHPARGYAEALERSAKVLKDAQTSLFDAMQSIARALPATADIDKLHEAAKRMGYKGEVS
jgi:hypothetical protein